MAGTPKHKRPVQRKLRGILPSAKVHKATGLAITGATGRAGKILSAASTNPKFAKAHQAEIKQAEKFMAAVELGHTITGESARQFLQAVKKAKVPGSSSEKKKPRF